MSYIEIWSFFAHCVSQLQTNFGIRIIEDPPGTSCSISKVSHGKRQNPSSLTMLLVHNVFIAQFVLKKEAVGERCSKFIMYIFQPI